MMEEQEYKNVEKLNKQLADLVTANEIVKYTEDVEMIEKVITVYPNVVTTHTLRSVDGSDLGWTITLDGDDVIISHVGIYESEKTFSYTITKAELIAMLRKQGNASFDSLLGINIAEEKALLIAEYTSAITKAVMA